jgi:hypothetical protein
MSENIQIVVTVPTAHLRDILEALASAGAGALGNYSYCSYVNVGTGRFKPNEDAHPAVGERGQINEVEEMRIEVICPRDRAKAVVAAVRAAHPYEVPVIYLLPLIDEDEL